MSNELKNLSSKSRVEAVLHNLNTFHILRSLPFQDLRSVPSTIPQTSHIKTINFKNNQRALTLLILTRSPTINLISLNKNPKSNEIFFKSHRGNFPILASFSQRCRNRKSRLNLLNAEQCSEVGGINYLLCRIFNYVF